jgi:outer membrane beta-barrel protein
MDRRSIGALVVAVATLAGFAPGEARADDGSDEVIENVVVRNRLFSLARRVEVAPSLGISIGDWLTSHYTLSAAASVNLTETFGIEARAGYALSRHTGYARSVGIKLTRRDPLSATGGLKLVDDLANLWEMRANVVGGIRWAPVYGKLSVMAETPVHFQAYAWLGGGMGAFHRQSVVYCLSVTSREDGTCGEWLSESRAAPLGSAAVGVRFFAGKTGSVKLELRDYAFLDSYRVSIDRAVAESGDSSSGSAARAGLTHLFMVDLGYTFIF